ncbi:aminodeoxychorismate synthase component I [Pseudohalioglobus sediminis]|uniref:aminodeoxychorismate synthase n=1 Tax=Pseudohalioglobus sediminis TaxID=2606449 RepID=A0A5B0X2W2_9GAMM|nr:aminodeoxychorismate synthase component I [Pseudohalioglobus sediminis]KAA1193045.1 aminodeoxychorismate synthase component I [Pseudohalioglobus sediminis]
MHQTVSLEELNYRPDSCELFEALRDIPGAALLDSSYPLSQAGRYDILCAQPVPAPANPPPGADAPAWHDYFSELGRFHRERYGKVQPAAEDIPFCGGLLGVLGYDSGNALHKVQATSAPTTHSGINLSAYDWAVIQDHLLQRAVLVAQPQVSAAVRRDIRLRLQAVPREVNTGFRLRQRFRSNLTEAEYRHAFERIQAYIQAGDCYQVNLAQRFSAGFEGDPWCAYRVLRSIAAAPFSAFLQHGTDSALLCLSPERFLRLHGHRVQTSPIKGTRPRHRDAAADQLAADALRASHKDRAENLMIVDLLRNDLGRNCIPGSIHVDALFEVQSFPTVHHLVSNITGELRADRGAYDLLRDSFPGGSITGAPKRRAMEIIAELEPHAREAYCGSVVYVSADGRMDSNIAIRSLLCHEGEIRCWGGGGIVADSQWRHEYQETFDKVGRFLAALESMS